MFISPVRKMRKYGCYYSYIPFNSIQNHLRKVSIVHIDHSMLSVLGLDSYPLT